LHRIIYTHGGGRLGNQVMRFAHWIAWALEHEEEVEVRNLAFWPYAKYFATWRAHPGCVFPLRPDGWDEAARLRQLLPEPVSRRLDWRLQRRVQELGRWRRGWNALELNNDAGQTLDLGDPTWIRRAAGSTTTTCAGWRIASWSLLDRHQAAVRGFFRPARDVAAGPGAFVGALRRRHDFVIGVHIRQGDYRDWHDGRFHFAMEQYGRWIRQALELHAGQNPVAVVVSDAPLAAGFGRGLPVQQRRDRPAMEDWTTLSLCDVILCAPSTFAATAAFQGGVALWPLPAADQVLAREQILPDGMIGAAHHTVFSLSVR